LKVFAEHMTKLLNGDEDDPKVRAAERASGHFIGSCANPLWHALAPQVYAFVEGLSLI
jgi:hypothetical protein